MKNLPLPPWVRTLVLPVAVLALVFGGLYYLSSHHQSDTFSANQTFPEVTELAGKSTTWQFQDYSNYFRKLATDKGALYAFEVLKRAQIAPNTDIHLLGHVVGDILYKQKGLLGIQYCTQDFRNACSHSIVVGYLEEHGAGSLPEIAKTCREAPGGRGAYTMCFHGLGHGVLAFNGYDLEKTIAMCKQTGTPEYQDREYVECVGGSIMEMISGVHDRTAWEKEVPKYFKKSDPLYPCDASFMPKEVQGICYTYLTPHLFETSGGDLGNLNPQVYGPSMKYCDAILTSEPDLRQACYGGFGKEFVTLAQSRDIRDIGSTPDQGLQKTLDACALAHDADGERACDSSALASLFWGGENNPDASFRFCALASPTFQDTCYHELAWNISFYLSNNPKGKALCSQLPSQYQQECMMPQRGPGGPAPASAS